MNILTFLVIAVAALWAVVSRPDRWAGAAEYFEAVPEVIEAFIKRRPASTKHLARFRFLNLMCLASSSMSLAILYGVSTLTRYESIYTPITIEIFKCWFAVTVVSLAIGLSLGPPLKGR